MFAGASFADFDRAIVQDSGPEITEGLSRRRRKAKHDQYLQKERQGGIADQAARSARVKQHDPERGHKPGDVESGVPLHPWRTFRSPVVPGQ